MNETDPDRSAWQKLLHKGGRKLIALLAFGALLLLIEIPLLVTHARHGYFGMDGWFAFYAVLGVAASIGVIFLSRFLNPILRRGSDSAAADEPLPEDIDERIR